MAGQEFTLEVNPEIPEALSRLPELSNDLWYSWHRPTRALFALLNAPLWNRTGHTPKLFLRSVDEMTLYKAAKDPVFLAAYHQVLADHDSYQRQGAQCLGATDFRPEDRIAYFCAEYGLHESFPIYSGGLGILAGDHCKTASDLCLPFVGVGLLYRQGYFTQNLDAEGNQVAYYHDSALEDLPVAPARDAEGEAIEVLVNMPGRDVVAKVWEAAVGRVKLYLLDTYLDKNAPEDREITHKLYGGGAGTRMRQEIILGIGGVRALRRLGYKPSVWHINEGHAAFLVLERVRQLVSRGLDYATALETVSAKTVFTTHTPVPAGHDVYPAEMVLKYFGPFIRELGISEQSFLDLGRLPGHGPDFNMTTLAVRCSRHQNGVSGIHGKVSAQICADCWPEVPVAENPMSYVTNGVHVPTFLAQAWIDLFDRFFGASWRNHLSDATFWKRIDEIPDHLFWSVSQSIKSQMYYALRSCLTHQFQRNAISEAHLERVLRHIDPGDPNCLTIGFARRFATYKRATLLANNLDWLRDILRDKERPLVFVFAGKAHPADIPGQDLLRQVHNLSNMPELVGKVLIVEGYDLALGRRLVSGVDVWLNNPIYPLEASGTSGMKAAINGRINLSVLDGWWAEGYDGENGWGIKPSAHASDEARRDYEDARTLYEILQDQVVPLYYSRGPHGYSPGWVRKCKRSMASILPRFNTARMVNDYCRQFYFPASVLGRRLMADDYALGHELARWKGKVAAAWSGVALRRLEVPPERIRYGQSVTLEIAVRLNGLAAGDVAVELLLSRAGSHESSFLGGRTDLGVGSLQQAGNDSDELSVAERFRATGQVPDTGEHRYSLELKPSWCGCLSYRVRAFPFHRELTHPHETGLMRWL